MTGIELKHESNKPTLSAGLAYYRAYPISALHAKSQLFMAKLTGKSC
jgi:hypothetical protein